MSSTPNNIEHDVDASSVEDHTLEGELEKSYIEYAMSVIVRRALPDVRDGLKPVQRRIGYTMSEQSISSSTSHRKSSSIIGETMGDYHPHGDASIYDTLVRMSQDFSMRVPLVDGQGNFGSIDGDPPAAMRYTEARMSKFMELLLKDLDKDTVDFSENYDGRLKEPDVLPSAFPNLLINGSEGIAVGVSTKIPPHNPGEVIDATVEFIDNPDATVEDLMEHIKGPDFPTGGKIVGTDSIEKAYKTGRGKLTVRGDYHFEEVADGTDNIIITEIPYEDKNRKADLVDDIATMVSEDRLEGVNDLRDESDSGIRIVIETKPSAIPEIVANKVVSEVLERTFGVIQLALVNGEPRVLTLQEMLQEYIDHRREVITRRTQHDLEEASDRSHILEGRLKALENVEDVVELIQDSDNRDSAKSELQETYEFSEDQAAHIVRMQLGSLTSMEEEDIKTEYDQLQAEIEEYEAILSSNEKLDEVVKEELLEVRSEFDNERKTDIVSEGSSLEMTEKDFIPEEEQILVITENDYVKRMDPDEITQYSRASKGLKGVNLRDGDSLKGVCSVNSHDELYIVTDDGTIYEDNVFSIPEQSRTARGTPLVNVLDIDKEESIQAIFTCDDLQNYDSLAFVTQNAYIKRTDTEEYDNIYKSGIKGIGLEDGDSVVNIFACDGDETESVMIYTEEGQSILFDLEQVRKTGRATKGVGAVKLKGEDKVASGMIVRENDHILTVTENGFGKATSQDKYYKQSRNGAGSAGIQMCDRNGGVVSAVAYDADERSNLSVLCSTEDGRVLRTKVDEIAVSGRRTKGVSIVDTSDGKLTSVSVFDEDQNE